jgi:hypothetical protein
MPDGSLQGFHELNERKTEPKKHVSKSSAHMFFGQYSKLQQTTRLK